MVGQPGKEHNYKYDMLS